MRNSATSFVTAIALLSLSVNSRAAVADDYQAAGQVVFGNVQATLEFAGESSPYFAIGDSPQFGTVVQTGSILPTSPPVLVDFDGTIATLQFPGVQGPHPQPGQGNIHIIQAQGGKIFCTWVAVFTIELNVFTGDSILSGDGDFTVVGGTGRFRGVSGTFRTLFETDVVLAGADTAFADWTQEGQINK